jgi:hypothetical protein
LGNDITLDDMIKFIPRRKVISSWFDECVFCFFFLSNIDLKLIISINNIKLKNGSNWFRLIRWH